MTGHGDEVSESGRLHGRPITASARRIRLRHASTAEGLTAPVPPPTHPEPTMFSDNNQEEYDHAHVYRRTTSGGKVGRYIHRPLEQGGPSNVNVGPSQGARRGPDGRFVRAVDSQDDDEAETVTSTNSARRRRGARAGSDWKITRSVEGGPEDPSIIPSFGGHVAMRIWDGEDRGVLKCHNRISTMNAWQTRLQGPAESALANCGIAHLRYVMHEQLNMPLISAFVERWQPDTNTFHMPFGEMTITLHDVYHLLRIPVEGSFVAANLDRAQITTELAITFDVDELEVTSKWQKGGIPFSFLRRYGDDETASLSANTSGYLMTLLGCTLFVDKSSDRMKLELLSVVMNRGRMRSYAWGASTLAWLYRQLGMASRAGTKQIAGCLTLLQSWIYSYFPDFAPPVNSSWVPSMPRCARYTSSFRLPRLDEELVTYRRALDRSTRSSVSWLPFGGEPWLSTQRTLYQGCLRYFNIVEPYHPERVLSQFGWLQIIPRDPFRPIRAERPADPARYVAIYADPDDFWRTADGVHCLQPDVFGQIATTGLADDTYDDWYINISHPIINKDVAEDAEDVDHDVGVSEVAELMAGASQIQQLYGVDRKTVSFDEVWQVLDQAFYHVIPVLNRIQGRGRGRRGGVGRGRGMGRGRNVSQPYADDELHEDVHDADDDIQFHD